MAGAGAEDLLALACALAREAGALLSEYFAREGRDVQTKSTPTDLVSEADHEAERLIRAALAERRPDDGILGEEGGVTRGGSGLRWIVDPLDGTVNFLFGHPQWGVTIAVEDVAGTLAGVVYDPLRDEEWTATRGGPAARNGKPIAGSARSDLDTALVATGFGYDAEVRRLQAETVARVLPRVRDIRRAGSAALDLAWTAAGRHDAYYERGVKRWDVAAGALICRRAGLDVVDLPATPREQPGILAAPPAMAGALRALVDA